MDKRLHSELPAAPDLTLEEVRDWAERAITETEQAKVKTYDLLAQSQRVLKQVDEILF